MFGERLRELRLASGLTLEGLAEASGVSVRAVSDLERGLSRAPRPRTSKALIAALAHPDAGSLTVLARQARESQPVGRRPADPPRADPLFIGRAAPLARIAAHAASRTPVAVVHGPPGTGKTALALRLAEDHAHLFPDGRFHLDLNGADGEPASVADLQNTLLRALAVSPRRIAADPGERTGQVRDALRQRRCLIILDDATDEAAVRPLLPASGRSLVLITSRHTLGGLEAVLRIALGPFTAAESAELLRAVAGPGAGTPAELARVAELCGHLPLALRVAGRSGGSMALLSTRLADADRRLSALGVEPAFAVSYRRLPEPARLLFRRTAHLGPGSFSAATAAVLAECDPYEAEDRCEELVERGLLQPDGYASYLPHDLLRLFAAARLRAEEPAGVRAEVRQRLHRWYLDTAAAAGPWFTAYGGRAGHVYAMVVLGVLHESRDRGAEAVAQYRRALGELERRPLPSGPHRIARVTASVCLARALGDCGRWAESLVVAEQAWASAGDSPLRGQAAMVLGWACAAIGDSERAQSLLREASTVLPDVLHGLPELSLLV
ncbi:MAG TPA: helix-turn-helix domain-containing protein [Actinoplanes sp.]|nr:helix-turn-helix domain-containing protein [Actinoplanes sp.]